MQLEIKQQKWWSIGTSKIQNLLSKSFIFSKNFGSVSAWFFAVSAETPKLAEMPISAETEAETENSVVHYQRVAQNGEIMSQFFATLCQIF